ncbi:MAG TPA: SDR family NAD(P)-dependent oxidoreductase, partial [Acidimicrobiales bacterium]
MDDLKGKVAVVTGGAGGVGRALVERFAAEGMRLVVADVEEAVLAGTVAALREGGAEAVGVTTDVTDFASVDALAEAAYAAYGAVHVLVNNAGVGPPGGLVWESTPNDWRWTFGVNVFGVAHGIQAFVPRMLASGEEGIVINTSSPDGPIAPMPQASVYAATKCAVTCVTECLAAQLAAESGGRLQAAVFYPSGKGLLDTGLWTSDRNRPSELARERLRETPP